MVNVASIEFIIISVIIVLIAVATIIFRTEEELTMENIKAAIIGLVEENKKNK